MKLLNRKNAFIAKAKLLEYLLSTTHPSGRSKSKFFREFGYNETNIDMFEQSLLKMAQIYEVSNEIISPHGLKYMIEGNLDTPSGRDAFVRTIWIIEKTDNRPRFITAYPMK